MMRSFGLFLKRSSKTLAAMLVCMFMLQGIAIAGTDVVGGDLTLTADKAITGATLTANLVSPQPKSTTIKLTANATGKTSKTTYKYTYSLNGGTEKTLKTWTKSSYVNWKPRVEGSYVLRLQVKEASVITVAPTLAFVIGTPGPTDPTISSVTAVNGTVTAVMSNAPATAVVGNFALTQSINGSTLTTVTPTNFVYSAGTATFTVPTIAQTTAAQNVTMNVSYLGATAVSGSFIVPAAGSGDFAITGVEVSNITQTTATITGTTSVVNAAVTITTTPASGTFTTVSNIDTGFFTVPVTGLTANSSYTANITATAGTQTATATKAFSTSSVPVVTGIYNGATGDGARVTIGTTDYDVSAASLRAYLASNAGVTNLALIGSTVTMQQATDGSLTKLTKVVLLPRVYTGVHFIAIANGANTGLSGLLIEGTLTGNTTSIWGAPAAAVDSNNMTFKDITFAPDATTTISAVASEGQSVTYNNCVFNSDVTVAATARAATFNNCRIQSGFDLLATNSTGLTVTGGTMTGVGGDLQTGANATITGLNQIGAPTTLTITGNDVTVSNSYFTIFADNAAGAYTRANLSNVVFHGAHNYSGDTTTYTNVQVEGNVALIGAWSSWTTGEIKGAVTLIDTDVTMTGVNIVGAVAGINATAATRISNATLTGNVTVTQGEVYFNNIQFKGTVTTADGGAWTYFTSCGFQQALAIATNSGLSVFDTCSFAQTGVQPLAAAAFMRLINCSVTGSAPLMFTIASAGGIDVRGTFNGSTNYTTAQTTFGQAVTGAAIFASGTTVNNLAIDGVNAVQLNTSNLAFNNVTYVANQPLEIQGGALGLRMTAPVGDQRVNDSNITVAAINVHIVNGVFGGNLVVVANADSFVLNNATYIGEIPVFITINADNVSLDEVKLENRAANVNLTIGPNVGVVWDAKPAMSGIVNTGAGRTTVTVGEAGGGSTLDYYGAVLPDAANMTITLNGGSQFNQHAAR